MRSVLHKTREEIREQYKELKHIIKRCNALGFEYVLQPQSSGGVCFGSTIPREVLPLKGPAVSPFMRSIIHELNYRLGPGVYYKYRVIPPDAQTPIGMKSKVPRFAGDAKPKYLYDGFYEVERPVAVKPDLTPFGVGTKLKRLEVTTGVPGVGTYNIQTKPRVHYQHSFGGKIRMVLPVKIICAPQHLDRCINCLEENIDEPPLIDYWKNFEKDVVYCRKCMADEKRKAIYFSKTKSMKIKRLKELESFSLVRYCGFMHRHENTTAKFRLLTPHEITKKHRREHYLGQFKIKFK